MHEAEGEKKHHTNAADRSTKRIHQAIFKREYPNSIIMAFFANAQRIKFKVEYEAH